MLEIELRGIAYASVPGFDVAIGDLEIANGVLVSISGNGGGWASWSLGANDLPQLLSTHEVETVGVTGHGPVLTPYQSEAGLGLIASGLAPEHIGTITLNASGSLGTTSDRGASGGMWAHAAQVRSDLFALSEAGGSGFRLFQENGVGDFEEVAAIADTDATLAENIGAMATAELASGEHLFVASTTEFGVTSFAVSGTSASVVDTIGAEDGLGLMIPTALEVTSVSDQTFLLVATAAPGFGRSGTLSVISVGQDGQLRPVDHVLDTRMSRFGMVQSLSSAKHSDNTFVVAAGGDAGVSLFILSASGRLIHIAQLADDIGSGLTSVEAIETAVIEDTLQVFVASGDTRGITVLEVDLSGVGVVRSSAAGGGTLSGSAGDDVLIDGPGVDTLSGGAGRDIYVFGADGLSGDQIVGFDPAADILDFSGWPYLYDPQDISIVSTSNGARLTWRGEDLTLLGVQNKPLDVDLVRNSIRIDINRSFAPPQKAADGNDGPDTLVGTWGNDTLYARGGDDVLVGGEGDDTLNGGGGEDTVMIDRRTDQIYSLKMYDDQVTIVSGDGSDQIRAVETFAFVDATVSFGDLANFAPPINLAGGAGNDRLEMTDGRALIEGGLGNDTLLSSTSNDTLIGGQGDDDIVGRLGDDSILGGDGNDTVDAGDGNDFVSLNKGQDSAYGYDGDDTLFGGDQDDFIAGGAGNDSIEGGSGDDDVRGGSGTDMLIGGEGDDTLSGQRFSDTLSAVSGNDRLFGGGGDDFLFGGEGRDYLRGGTRKDYLEGRKGNDTLYGNDYSDTLYGGAGEDLVNGGGGDDRLAGGAGRDTIKGGEGADVFLFRKGYGRDLLLDFSPYDDMLNIDSALVNGRSTEELAASAYWTGKKLVLDFGHGDSVEFWALEDTIDLADAILFV